MNPPADYDHLLSHAQRLFSSARIEITYTEDETIHIDVDRHRFTFEIGSDDDAYIFNDGVTAFEIPLMENPDVLWISPDAPSEPILLEMSVPNEGDDQHDHDYADDRRAGERDDDARRQGRR